MPRVYLTAAHAEIGQRPQPVSLGLSEFISYSREGNRTRLSLAGRKVLLVKETTDKIDRLVRAAASRTDKIDADIPVPEAA